MSDLDFSLISSSTDSASGVLHDYRTWRRSCPELSFAQYVNENPGIETSILIELASSDLIHQITNGQPRRAEDYLAVIPAIVSNDELVLDLIDAEICAQADMGNRVDRGLLESRFPKLKEKLAKLLDVHAIDLEASQDTSFSFSQPSLEIPGYRLERISIEIPRGQHSPGFDLWEATDNEGGLPCQIVVWPLKKLTSSPANQETKRVEEILAKRIQIENKGLAEIVEFGFVDSDSTGYTYVVVRPLMAKSLVELFTQDSNDSIAETTMIDWMLKLCETHLILEKSLGISTSFSANEILIDRNNSPVLLDFIGLMSESKNDPLQMLGLLIFSICLREEDVREIRQHLDSGYDPIELNKANENVSENMNAIYLSCVHPNPRRRYTDLSAAIVDLQKFKTGQSLQAFKLQRKKFWFGG